MLGSELLLSWIRYYIITTNSIGLGYYYSMEKLLFHFVCIFLLCALSNNTGLTDLIVISCFVVFKYFGNVTITTKQYFLFRELQMVAIETIWLP